MLHIILLILKIIGIVVLVLLGLLLTALFLVLFVPIRYRVRGSYHGKSQGLVKITWLLHIVSVTVSYDEDFVIIARIFGFPVMKPGLKAEEETEDFVVQAMETTAEDSKTSAGKLLKDMEISEEKKQPWTETRRGDKKQEADRPTQEPGPASHQRCESTVKSSLFSRLLAIFSKLRFSFSHICDRLKKTAENITEKKDGIQEWITNEENKKTVRLLFRQTKKLILHILPRKGKGNVVFGFEDPYITGQVLTYLSVVYPFCHRHLEFLPIFDCDRLVLEADGDFRGRIRLGALLAIAVRVLLNKNFRVILKRWMR